MCNRFLNTCSDFRFCSFLNFLHILYTKIGRDSSVAIATTLCAGRSGDRIPLVPRFSAPVQTGPVTHPASYIKGTESLPGVKRPGRDTDHLPTASSAEVKEIVEL